MKLTKKSVKTEVETTETVCEISQDEFEKLCAEVAATTVVKSLGDDPDIDDLMAGVAMTSFLAEFTAKLTGELFNDKTENPDKKEEK